MASFCGSCGFPLGANTGFCPKCGTRQATGGSAPLAPASGGSGFKVLLIVLGCIGVLGVAFIGGLWYVGHRVKEAVVQKAQENGVDLHDIIPPEKKAFFKPKRRKPCDILSNEEVAALVGEPIERAEVKDSACMYYGPEGLSAKLAGDLTADTVKKVKTPGANVNGTELIGALDQITNAMGAASGEPGSNGEFPMVMLMIDWEDGRSQLAAVNMSKAIFGGILHGSDADKQGLKFGEDIKGLGDRAVRIPKLGLNVLQNETLIRIITGPLPNADAKTIDVARAVLKKL
jgi:hypothetical protein